jgi:hypothetical protein
MQLLIFTEPGGGNSPSSSSQTLFYIWINVILFCFEVIYELFKNTVVIILLRVYGSMANNNGFWIGFSNTFCYNLS